MIRIALFLCISFLLCMPKAMADSVVLTGKGSTYCLQSHITEFHDYHGVLNSVEQAYHMMKQGEHGNYKKPFPKLYDKWVLLEFDNQTQFEHWYLSFGFSRLPEVALYQVLDDGFKELLNLSNHTIHSERPVDNPQQYLNIHLPSAQETKFILRYQTFANAPANIRLHNEQGYTESSHKSLIVNAALAGLILSILMKVITNLCFNINLTNVFYAIWTALFFIIVIDMAGFTFEYFWPDDGFFAGYFSIGLMAVVPVFHLLFVKGFLQLKIYNKQLATAYDFFIGLYTVLIPVSLYFETVYYNLIASTLIIPLFAATCWWSYQQDAPGSKLFTFSLLNHMLFVNVLTIVGASFGNMINVFEITTFIKVGYLVEVILFTIALAIQNKSVQMQLVSHLETQVHALSDTVKLQQKSTVESQCALKAKEKKLFTDLSHELRTPLTVMKIQVESLQFNIVENVQDSYNKLMDKIDELNDFINQLMLVTEKDKLGEMMNKQKLLLDVFVSESQILCESRVQDADCKLVVVNELAGYEEIIIDSESIQKSMLEIIDNAVSYGGQGVEIKLSYLRSDDNFLIRIEDSGMPLSYEAHQHLFEPLFREDEARNKSQGQKGMGLALCKKVVEAHDGQISSFNSLMGGLNIEIVLPLESQKLAVAH